MLYTDGLVETRTSDIDEGLARLRATFGPGTASRSMEELCKATLAGVYADHQRDDIAVLMARLRRLGRDQHVTWKLASELTSARRARLLVRRRLKRWGLSELIPTAELLASELVTNAVRYASRPVTLRLLRTDVLRCEVGDDVPQLPRLRQAKMTDEGGRGLYLVNKLARRWGATRLSTGKVVWFELNRG